MTDDDGENIEQLDAALGRSYWRQQALQEENDRLYTEVLRLDEQVASLTSERDRLRDEHECCWHDGHDHGDLGWCSKAPYPPPDEVEARAALSPQEGA